jgi:FKBP-type peptidyl-prolyl cis-trans isomerase FklB
MLENQAKEGVKTMPSGLQYKVLKKGDGTKPAIDDYVTFNYRARTLDGREYDSSSKKGGPVTYRANGVLPGFTEAIQMMRPGAKWELYLPPEQAYGRQGPIAHQTIILEVELLSIGK